MIRHLLFIYILVNTGVLYFLDYVEDIYIMVLSVLVAILYLNHIMYLPLILTVYCIALYTYKLCTTMKWYLKKNQSTPRPSEHPPVMGGEMSKRLGGIKGRKIQNLFMAFKQVPRCR